MADANQLNFSWLADLTNPNHDGTTQQIDDFVQAYQSDNAVFNQKKAVLHTARQNEDHHACSRCGGRCRHCHGTCWYHSW